jgi:hypothetical protein
MVTCCRRFFRRPEKEKLQRDRCAHSIYGQRETIECQGTLMDSKVKYGRIEVEHKRPTENLTKKATECGGICRGDAVVSNATRSKRNKKKIQSSDRKHPKQCAVL